MENLDNLTIENHPDFKPCMKKPLVVHACPISEPFSVTTLEGPVYGKAGDYLMVGVDGEKYPCAKAIFEKSYDFVEQV